MEGWTEADEMAAGIIAAGHVPDSAEAARFLTRQFMPGEAGQIIDNVAESLLTAARGAAPSR